jgi:DHA2 family multidrug resistance protein-like MFS transporter
MEASRSTLGGALSAAEHLPAQLGAQLASAARVAFTHGLDAAALGAAIAMIVAAVLSARFFRGIEVVPDGAESGALDPATPGGSGADGAGTQPELVR